jgi:hypothetical protein
MSRVVTSLVAPFVVARSIAAAPAAKATEPAVPAIEAQRAAPGAIYVLPPAGGEIADAFAAGLGLRLRQHLAAFVLAMQVPEPPLRILELPPAAVPPPAQLIAQLDALALAVLRLDTVQGRGRVTRTLSIVLHFAPVPGLSPRIEFAAASAAPDAPVALAEFERSLGPRWTRHAVLAIAAREFALLGAAAEPPRLRALQHFLAQEARQAVPGDPDAAALQSLRDTIDQAPRLRGRR